MLAYCDYIAHVISTAFNNDKPENKITQVGRVKMDLHPIDGYMLSTKKTITMEDFNGKLYKVTVEEI
jgi:hypothetical protein